MNEEKKKKLEPLDILLIRVVSIIGIIFMLYYITKMFECFINGQTLEALRYIAFSLIGLSWEIIFSNYKKEVDEWIPVEQDLPTCYLDNGEFFNPVIVTYLSSHEKEPRVTDLALYDEENGIWRWYEHSEDSLAEMDEVFVTITAWMPLPKPYRK